MTIAMYLRLSSEDGDLRDSGKAESESISNQRALLQNFIRSHAEFAGAEIREFCDDGWSGKNFERPGFVHLMEEVKASGIQCVVVKDLSRFGRDYLIVGNYIGRVFPFLGVRFIAVNDNFDSARQADIDSLDTSFKTLIYDLYSRELSGKVRSAKRQRAEKGLFLSPFAPYGYVKDPENKNLLRVDPEAAETVRRIFKLRAEKQSEQEIAAILNFEDVPSPMRYKRAAGCSRTYWPCVHEENFWTSGTVCIILRDERYLGKTVFGKRERDKVGLVHTVKKSKSDWIVVDEVHEPIVSEELFQAAQAAMREYTERSVAPSPRNPLRRKVICGVCGYAMQLSTAKNAKYACRTAKLGSRFDCPSEGVPQADIHEAVVSLIRTYAQYAVELERLKSLQDEHRRAEESQIKKDLSAIRNRLERLETAQQVLYEKLIDGTISREDYLSQKQRQNEESQALTARIAELEAALRTHAASQPFIEKYKSYTELTELTSDIANDLVKRVVVYPDNRLEIELNLHDELEALLAEKHL